MHHVQYIESKYKLLARAQKALLTQLTPHATVETICGMSLHELFSVWIVKSQVYLFTEDAHTMARSYPKAEEDETLEDLPLDGLGLIGEVARTGKESNVQQKVLGTALHYNAKVDLPLIINSVLLTIPLVNHELLALEGKPRIYGVL